MIAQLSALNSVTQQFFAGSKAIFIFSILFVIIVIYFKIFCLSCICCTISSNQSIFPTETTSPAVSVILWMDPYKWI